MFLANAHGFERGYAGMLRNVNAMCSHFALGNTRVRLVRRLPRIRRHE